MDVTSSGSQVFTIWTKGEAEATLPTWGGYQAGWSGGGDVTWIQTQSLRRRVDWWSALTRGACRPAGSVSPSHLQAAWLSTLPGEHRICREAEARADLLALGSKNIAGPDPLPPPHPSSPRWKLACGSSRIGPGGPGEGLRGRIRQPILGSLR